MENIIYEDKDFIVYNKPSGMLVQSDKSFEVDLVSMLLSYLVQKGEKPNISVINRLDRPVSGLVLLAKNKEAAAKASKELSAGRIHKEYLAVVQGRFMEKKGEFIDYLQKDVKTNTSRVVSDKTKGAKKAVLEYEVLAAAEKEELSLVRIRLVTGRHHQIRVQFASRGHALYGDTKYNEKFREIKGWFQIALCSYRISFLGKSFSVKPKGEGFVYFQRELETI